MSVSSDITEYCTGALFPGILKRLVYNCRGPVCGGSVNHGSQPEATLHDFTFWVGRGVGVWCTPWVGQIVTFFACRPPSAPQGSLTPTQPGRVTNPTQGHPGPPWEAPQAECWSLRREPKPPA